MRIALGQINPTVGDFPGNSAKIVAYAQRAKSAGVELLDLSTGEPYDLPLVRFFRERARRVARAGG